MNYIGDFVEDATVYILFNTFSSDDPSASCTITNLLNTDVHIHKDDGLTQRCNAAGITVSVNFDGITGSHMIKIDTSDNTVAGFWVTGHDYFVRIEGTTVDAATINAVVGHFSIQNRFMRGTDSAALAATALTDVTWTDGKAGHIDAPISTVDTVVDGIQTDLSNVTDGLGALKALLDTISGYTDKIDDATNGLTAIKAEVEGLAGAAMRGTDSANTTVPDAAGVAPTAIEIRQEMDTNSTKMAPSQTLNDYKATGFSTHNAAAVKTAIEAGGSSIAQILADTNELELDWKNTGRLDNLLDACNTVTPDAAGTLATYDPPTRTEATADKDAIIADLLTMKKKAAGTWNRETDSLEAIRDRGDAAWVTAAGFSTHDAAAVKTAIEAAGSSIALMLADTGELQTDWVNGGRLDNLLDAIPTTAMRGTDGANTTVPDAAGVAPTAAEIQTEMEGAGSKLLAIEGDTNELQTDWHDGGRLDLLIDAILLDTGTTLDGKLNTILGLNQENFFIDNTTYAGGLMTGARIRIYSVAGSVGTASDVIATYTVTATYAGSEMASYKVVKS